MIAIERRIVQQLDSNVALIEGAMELGQGRTHGYWVEVDCRPFSPPIRREEAEKPFDLLHAFHGARG